MSKVSWSSDDSREVGYFSLRGEIGKRFPLIERAEGVYIFDKEGRRYLDGSSGVVCVNIGYGVKEVNEAMRRQAEKTAYAPFSFESEPALKLAELITKLTPKPLRKVTFVSGGSEAVETAIKLARAYHLENGDKTKYKVISRWLSFHGNTLGALSATGYIMRRRPYEPLLQDWPHIPPAYCYRCPYGKTYPDCDIDCALELERTIKRYGPEYISAFIAEPFVGTTAGCIYPPKEYFPIIRETCDKYNVLFIADEVMTGFGRTGKNFGIDHWNVTPDIMACSKGLGCGYTPIGCVIFTNKIYETFSEGSKVFIHGFTYMSNPLSCAIAYAVISYLLKNKLVEKSAELGETLGRKLNALYEHHKSIGDIRGKGLFYGVEFVQDRETKKPFPSECNFAATLLDKAMDNGLVLYSGSKFLEGEVGDHVHISPPLIITLPQIDELIELFSKSLTDVEKNLL